MKYSMILAFLLSSLIGSAQLVQNPYPRTITVNGSAEMEIVPDEIYVQVILKEYDKKGVGKVPIESIRKDFLERMRKLGIADSLISITSYDGSHLNPWINKKYRRSATIYSTANYQMKLRSSKQLDDVVAALDEQATDNFYIMRTATSRMAEHRNNLKMEAVRQAKIKAQNLAQAIGENIGVAVTINEPTEYYQPYYGVYGRASNMMMKTQSVESMDMAAPQEEPNQPDFRKIKLKYDVMVVFELK